MVSTDLGRSKYADRSRQLMGAARKMRELGAQALLDIPRIAVIGGQSAGKSSLVEAVSGIRVPRDGGTCTRCPIEVNLINELGKWSCRITLRFEYDLSGNRTSGVVSIPFGQPLTSIDDVELTLRRAQAAILNYPREHSDLFLMKSREELDYYRTPEAFQNGTLKFSKNSVVVDIFDPECANLSFIDLPGLIQNDEPHMVQLVEDVVRSNIQGNCLILATIPMSDDMENQRAMRLALEADQDKSRTIGVLTKPDTLTSGAISSRKKWKDLLTGADKTAAYALRHGYYCVKLADDVERDRNPSKAERNANESTFFSTTSPWDAVPDRNHFGVRNLVIDLSKLLTMILDQKLPQLRKQAQDELDEARAALTGLPAPLHGDFSSEVILRITNFCQEFSGTVYGNISGLSEIQKQGHSPCCGKSFIQRNRAIYKVFKNAIRSTAPDFRPFEDHEDYSKPCFWIQKVIVLKRELETDLRTLNTCFNNLGACQQRSLRCETYLIDEFTEEWDVPTTKCFEEVYQNLVTCLEHMVHRNFDRFQKLQNYMEDVVKDTLHAHKSTAYEPVLATLKQEKHPLFTQNDHYFRTLRLHWLAEYTEARMNQYRYSRTRPPSRSPSRSPSLGIYAPNPAAPLIEFDHLKVPMACSVESVEPIEPEERGLLLNRAINALRALGYSDVTRGDLLRLRTGAPDVYSEELMVMADVRAYFFVAYKRIIDNVPLSIEHQLNQALAENMKRALLQELNLGAPDATKRLKDLVEEDPGITQKREELTSKIDKLEKIELELRILLA